MNEEQKRRAEAIIQRQLAMNESTLAAMRRAGLAADATVQLDVTFMAPNRERAESLKSRLGQNECLDMVIFKRPGLFSRQFVVAGKSHPTTLSSELLGQWVQWMVVQGVLENCEFDGWGTEVPA